MSETEMEKTSSNVTQLTQSRRVPSENRKDGTRIVYGTGRSKPSNEKPYKGQRYNANQQPFSSSDKRPKGRSRQLETSVEDLMDQLPEQLVRGKKVDITHLLDFQFRHSSDFEDPYAVGYSHSARGQPRRRGVASSRLKLEQYLHANCQFIVKQNRNYIEHNIDPDKLIDWESIEQVKMMSTEIPCCPICLHPPTAAKITKCGHVYCSACILHFITLEETNWVNCPVCKAQTGKAQLKSVQAVSKPRVNVGDLLTLRLMKREKGAVYTMPLQEWTQREGEPHAVDDDVSTCFSKLLTASPEYIRSNIIAVERLSLQEQLKYAEDMEICFIEQALELLKTREEKLDEDSPKTSISEADIVEPLPASTCRSRTTSSADSHRSDSFTAAHSRTSESQSCDNSEPDVGLETALASSLASTAASSDELETAIHKAALKPSAEAAGLASTPASQAVSQSQVAAVMAAVASQHLDLPPELHEADDNSKRKNARAPNRLPPANTHFYYYQATDGQHIYLDSINSRCLAHQYGSLDQAPTEVSARVQAIHVFAMTEELRKQHRYLNHVPLSCQFRVSELKLEPPLVSKQTLLRFKKQIDARRQERERRQRVDRQHNRKAEVAMDKLMGKFTAMRCSVESAQHFPSMHGSLSESDVSGLDDQRPHSPLEPELPDESSVIPLASNFIDDTASSSMKVEASSPSYSQMLKHANCAVTRDLAHVPRDLVHMPMWPALSPRAELVPESGDELGLRPANYKQSWANDLSTLPKPQAAAEEPASESPGSGKKKKGKKKEKILLFSTEMRSYRQ